MVSFSSISEHAIGEAPSTDGSVTIVLPAVVFAMEADPSFTLLLDYFAHLPALAFTLSADAAMPVVDAWLRYPSAEISFDVYPVRAATGIAVTLPVITIDLAITAPMISTGAALHMPALSFTVDAYDPAIGGIQLALPSIAIDLTWPNLKLTEGATVDFNVLRFIASGFSISEVPISAAGPLVEQRADIPQFMVRVFPIVPKMGTAIMLPALTIPLSADAIEAISRPRSVTLLAIAS